MPSVAYKTFQYNLVDVNRLIVAYNDLSPTGPGRRGLGHITRSIVVILCASWEQYIEDMVIELVKINIKQHELPSQLPKPVQKTISKSVKEAKHDLKPLELAGVGWRKIYLDCAQEAVASFHSPKSTNVANLFQNYIGITTPVWEFWSLGEKHLDDFVSVRNKIVHKGRRAGRYTKFKAVKRNKDNIQRMVMETDNFLYDQLSEIFPKGSKPWRGKVK